MERRVGQIDSWGVCDQLCGKFFDKTPQAWDKAFAWCERDDEFVKRAGFVQLAVMTRDAEMSCLSVFCRS
ncbi:MAG: DNA alkylation repair protein [Chitinivibrionales bacterium]